MLWVRCGIFFTGRGLPVDEPSLPNPTLYGFLFTCLFRRVLFLVLSQTSPPFGYVDESPLSGLSFGIVLGEPYGGGYVLGESLIMYLFYYLC